MGLESMSLGLLKLREVRSREQSRGSSVSARGEVLTPPATFYLLF